MSPLAQPSLNLKYSLIMIETNLIPCLHGFQRPWLIVNLTAFKYLSSLRAVWTSVQFFEISTISQNKLAGLKLVINRLACHSYRVQ